MQVGALGSVNSVAIQSGQEQVGQESGFASVLLGLTQVANSSSNAEQSVNIDNQQFSMDELQELLQLLNVSDLSELGFGSELLEQLLSNKGVNLNELILENLQISDGDLKSAITSILHDVNIDQSIVNSGLSKAEDSTNNLEEISSLIEEIPQMDGQEALMAFVQILPLLNLEGITFKTDQDLSNLAKPLKLLELLSNYEKIDMDQKSLKDFLRRIEGTLEIVLKEDHTLNRKEYLQKVFTPVIKSANEYTLPNRQTQPVLTSTELIAGGGMDEEFTVQQSNKLDSFNGVMFQFQQMSKPEQLTLMQAKSGSPVSTEELIVQFEKILSKSQLFKTGGTQRLFIKLHPDHLGALKVELIQKDSSMIAKIVTTNSTAKDLLESQLQSLKQAFGLQNIQLDKIEIFQQMTLSERFLNKNFQQQGQQQEQRKNEEQNQRDDDQPFSRSFEEALISAEA